MKKIILFSVVACSVAFYACKKDNKDTTVPPVTEIPADTLNPSELSAGTTVGSAISAKGDIPATTSGAPVLEVDGYDNRVYSAVSGRYIVIYPKSSSGFIAGYYVKINGADSYFKINYAKAAEERKAARQKSNKGNLREEGDNSDSSIIIKLPADIKGDTFSIKYAAYDSLNRVSNTLTAIVNLLSTDSTSNSLLTGKWFYNRRKNNNNDWMSWADEIDSSYITCNAPNDGRIYECPDNSCTKVLSYLRGDSTFIQFSNNNQLTISSYYIYRNLDWEASTCNALVYNDESYTEAYTSIGGYSYSAATKTVTFINDGNGSHDPYNYASNLYTQQYKVKELSATKLVIYQTQYYNEGRDYIDTYYQEFLKK